VPGPLPPRAYDYGARASGEAHGVVLTKPEVVALILDLAGYTADKDLAAQVLCEPACGRGAFILPAAERLLIAARRTGRDLEAVGALEGALRAFDIDPKQVATSRRATAELLVRCGLTRRTAQRLAAAWIKQADFLLAPEVATADYVVGNPPYVRIEQLPPPLQAQYRQRYRSLYDRADLYVAFIERALQLIGGAGVLAFICADRWTRNRYGAPLRRLLTQDYQLRCYVDLRTAAPFESTVAAYPCICVVAPRTGEGGAVPVVTLETASPAECAAVVPLLRGEPAATGGVHLTHYPSWPAGTAPWLLSPPEHLAVLRELEARWPPLEQVAGTRVGIGVATGNDRLYIVDRSAAIEPDRLVPLVLREDLQQGRVLDRGRCVINTFEADGRPLELARYPRLGAYLTAHEEALRRRHVARRSPAAWFRTIDRVCPDLAARPKLLLPDIASASAPVLERGRFLPHHNLYFITASGWDLETLGGLLGSQVALLFIWSYAVKMRGGYLRFQAQYLRRIRVPPPTALAPPLAADLRAAFRRRDFAALDALALRAYGLKVLPAFPFADTRQ